MVLILGKTIELTVTVRVHFFFSTKYFSLLAMVKYLSRTVWFTLKRYQKISICEKSINGYYNKSKFCENVTARNPLILSSKLLLQKMVKRSSQKLIRCLREIDLDYRVAPKNILFAKRYYNDVYYSRDYAHTDTFHLNFHYSPYSFSLTRWHLLLVKFFSSVNFIVPHLNFLCNQNVGHIVQLIS